jgi:pyruvate dehydrogenase E2 component (dihydrolipoamide acetyltransferase)
MRKTIARRLAQSMQQAPHIYLTVDIRLDKLHGDAQPRLNAALEKQGIKLSVNDMLIKALGKALIDVPECNVTFAGAELIRYSRADISVAVSIPGGLITPIVQDASATLAVFEIARATNDLAAAGQGRKAAARRVPGRHRQHLEHGDDGDQAVYRCHQSAAIDHPGHRRRREAALGHA